MPLSRRCLSKTPQKQDRTALKNIVEPFLSWHNSVFGSCLEEIKAFPDYCKIFEESFSSDGSFEVNEETMFNILSADIKGNSKSESLNNFEILPSMPKCIAKRYEDPKNGLLFQFDDSFESDQLLENCSSSEENSNVIGQRKFSFSDDFVDTEKICRDLKHLKIMDEFITNSEEYLQFKKIKKN